MAGQWEPDESRGSSPVLREPGGEIPPGYSPCAKNATGGCDVEDRTDGCGAALVMEVWPSEAALQGEVSNYCELLW